MWPSREGVGLTFPIGGHLSVQYNPILDRGVSPISGRVSIATKMRDLAQQNRDIAGGQKWQDTIGNIVQSRKQMDYHKAAAPLLSGDPSGFQNYYNKWVNPSNPIVSIQKTPDGKFVGTFQDGTQSQQPLSTDQLGAILTHQHYFEDTVFQNSINSIPLRFAFAANVPSKVAM